MKIKITAALAAAMLSFALTVNGQTTLNVPSGTVGTSNNTNVGIGTLNPSGQLHIEAPNVPGTMEVLLKATAADAPNDFLTIQNATGGNGSFIPNIWGHYTGAVNRGLFFTGSTNSTNDVVSNVPLITFDGRQFNSGVASAIVNRPIFQVSNLLTPLMTVNANGKLGIGTLSPSASLQITNPTDAGLRIQTTTNGNLSFQHSMVNSTWAGLTHPYILQAIEGSGTSDMVFTPVSNTPTSGLVIRYNGNVGIGTTNPGTKLHVNGTICNGGSDFILGSNDGRAQGSLPSNRALVHNDLDILTINYGGDFEGGVQIGGKGMFIGDFTTNYTASWPTGYKLYVKEGILTERVKVALYATTDWSDFVFDKSYKLMPLAEVEKFVSKNKHLPDVPCAEEMVCNGLDVAKMDAKLLQKIEELTLYIIEMKKEIEALKDNNIQLKNK